MPKHKLVIGEPILTRTVFICSPEENHDKLGEIRGADDLGYNYFPEGTTGYFKDEYGNPISYATMEEVEQVVKDFYSDSFLRVHDRDYERYVNQCLDEDAENNIMAAAIPHPEDIADEDEDIADEDGEANWEMDMAAANNEEITPNPGSVLEFMEDAKERIAKANLTDFMCDCGEAVLTTMSMEEYQKICREHGCERSRLRERDYVFSTDPDDEKYLDNG